MLCVSEDVKEAGVGGEQRVKVAKNESQPVVGLVVPSLWLYLCVRKEPV